MTENNIILIHGGAYPLVKKALQNWLKLYAENLQSDFSFKLFKNGRGKHIIKTDARLDNENFNYLVNYLHYPEGVEYQAKIHGLTTAQDTTVFPKELIGKSILVTVPENDNDYDCVYVVTQDNQPMKIDFGGKVEKLSLQQQFYEPEIDFAKLEKPEVLKPAKTAFLKATQNTTIQKVDRPFWRGYIYFALWLIGFTALHKVDLKFAGIFIGWGFSNFLLYCRKSPWSTDVYRWVVTISFFIPGIIGLFYSDSYDLLFFCWALTIPFFHNIFDRLFKNLSIKYHGRDFYLYMNGSQEINTGFGAKNPHVRTTDILFSIALFIITSLLLMFPVFFKFF